jgi:cytochrome P450
MNRVAEVSLTLPDGSVIPKGATCGVPTARQWDPAVYENPEKFDGHRFYDMRQKAGNESKFQFVSTGDDYIPFGHGKHACPGRFFASNEIKIIISQLLMKYDIKFADGLTTRPKPKQIGSDLMTDPDMKILFKARALTGKV